MFPVTIVTGFLGAGKTTLIRHVVANAQGRRLAVIVNEFGDVGIDGEILKGCGNAACPEENIVELANGCRAAPSPTNSCRRSMPSWRVRASSISSSKPPASRCPSRWCRPSIGRQSKTVSRWTASWSSSMAQRSPTAASRDDLNALAEQRVTDTALSHDDPIEEVFEDQIACADLVVLNKRDLIDETGLAKAQAAIADALPRSVKVIPAADGKVDQRLLLGLGVGTEHDIANRRTHHDNEEEHDHDDFDSFVVPLKEVADPAALAARVTALAKEFDVLRVKGFAAVANKPLRLLVQAVGPRVTHQYDRPWTADETREGRLVVIGLKGLDRAGVVHTLVG